MCEALQELFKEEIEEKVSKGREDEHVKTLLDSIQKVMSKLHYTTEQALDFFEVPTNERKKYISML